MNQKKFLGKSNAKNNRFSLGSKDEDSKPKAKLPKMKRKEFI